MLAMAQALAQAALRAEVAAALTVALLFEPAGGSDAYKDLRRSKQGLSVSTSLKVASRSADSGWLAAHTHLHALALNLLLVEDIHRGYALTRGHDDAASGRLRFCNCGQGAGACLPVAPGVGRTLGGALQVARHIASQC